MVPYAHLLMYSFTLRFSSAQSKLEEKIEGETFSLGWS